MPPPPDCRARGKQQDEMLRESWALSLPQDPTWEAKKHKDLFVQFPALWLCFSEKAPARRDWVDLLLGVQPHSVPP